LDTQCLTIGGEDGNQDQQVLFRSFGNNVLDQPIPLYTGTIDLSRLGIGKDRSTITLKRVAPLKQHILSVNRMISVND
jgi:hypothetical protein